MTRVCGTLRAPLSSSRWLLACVFIVAGTARAADPAAGNVSPTNGSSVAFTGTAVGTGAANGEGDCVDGVTCDTFDLTITGQPADYEGKVVAITINWTVPANDYDLVVHKTAVDGPVISTSGNGPPFTTEKAAIRPSDHGTGKYVVHVIYFAGVMNADQYHGTATTRSADPFRTGNYLKGGAIKFSPNLAVKAPVARRDGEPSSRTDFKGNVYVGGIRGVPAGIDLWYFNLNPSSPDYDPLMRNPIYRGQPDAFSPDEANSVGADGGGDIDLAVGFASPSGQANPTLSFSSLVLANVSTGNSTDRGMTFNLNPTGNIAGAPVNDRQWQEFFGDHTVFLLYRTLDPVIGVIQRSTDGGFTFEPGTILGGVAQTGGIDVDQNDGTVYAVFNDGRVAVGTPLVAGDAPAAYTFHQAVDDPNNPSHLFCILKVADDGTVYVCYSNGEQVFLAFSKDKAVTWSAPVRVSDLGEGTNIFPAMETGPLPGSVAIAWYGAPNEQFNNNFANWKVYFAQSFNATAQSPTFTQVEASDHVIHASNISEGGLNGSANRNLLDYFQISFDPTGAAVIGYTDDHNDILGHTYVTRQIAGPSVKGGALTLPNPVPALSPPPGEQAPPPQPGPNGQQVTDFAQDAASGSNLARISAPNPADILSIKYISDLTPAGKLLLTATMKVSDLTAVPPNATYRMTLAANAPDAVLSATGDNTYGVPDRGDQFFFAVTTDASATPTFRYGTAVRNSNGSITYTNASPTPAPSGSPTPVPDPSPTPAGTADGGSVDSGKGTLSVTVDAARLNDILLASGQSPIQTGSALVGLRGTASGAGQSDDTRGGTVFVVGNGPPPTPTPTGSPTPPPTPTPTGTPPNVSLVNISARADVQKNENVDIAGFIITGKDPKRIVLRGVGPSLKVGNKPLAGALQDPFLELRDSVGATLFTNDNYKESPTVKFLDDSGLKPKDGREAAIVVSLPPGEYTGILRGAHDETGIGLVEVYDLDVRSNSQLGNLSARAFVSTGDNVLIDGLILRGGKSKRVLLRAIGPTLAKNNVPNFLDDPTLELHDQNGGLLAANDNWRQAGNAGEIRATGLAPENKRESAILMLLPAGNYTAVVRGADGSTGVALAEAYRLGN